MTPPTGDRFRGLLLVTSALTAVVIYLAWWLTYSGIHLHERFEQLPPGQPGLQHGSSVRLLSLTRTNLLVDSDGGDPGKPDPGAVWVVAELEATVKGSPDDFFCVQTLVGTQQRVWESTTPTVDRKLSYCDHDDIKPGTPYRFEMVYQVPEDDADQLAGIALSDSSTPDRTPVLAPAA